MPQTVKNALNQDCDIEAIAGLMDDDLREEMHFGPPDPAWEPQAFFEEYARRHHDKFGEAFAPWIGNAW